MGVILALACCVAWGAADFFGGMASNNRPALVVVLVAQVFGLVAAVVPAISAGIQFSGPSLLLAGAAGVCSAIAFLAFYSALAAAPMGIVAPVVGTSVIIPVAAGMAQGHWPPPAGVVGLALATIGASVAVGLPGRAGTGKLTTRVKGLCLVATLGFGGAITLFAQASTTGTIQSTVAMRITSVSVLLAITVVRWRRDGHALIGVLRELPYLKVAASGVLDVLGDFCFAVALSFSSLLPVAVLSGAYPVATAVLAWALIGERLTGRQRFGCTAAVFGAALMVAG